MRPKTTEAVRRSREAGPLEILVGGCIREARQDI